MKFAAYMTVKTVNLVIKSITSTDVTNFSKCIVF